MFVIYLISCLGADGKILISNSKEFFLSKMKQLMLKLMVDLPIESPESSTWSTIGCRGRCFAGSLFSMDAHIQGNCTAQQKRDCSYLYYDAVAWSLPSAGNRTR